MKRDDKSVDVIIFSGQSNMQGSTAQPGTSSAQNCLEYKYLTDEFVLLQDPVGEDIGEDLLRAPAEGCGSLVPAFCKVYEKKKRRVVAMHCAKGNTRIDEWEQGTPRYNAMMEKCKKGIERTREQFTIENIYFVWLQGESDALAKNTEEGYLAALVALKNALKLDLGIQKFGIIKVGYFAEYAYWVPDANKVNDEIIMRAQERAPKEDADFVILTKICAKLSVKNKHLNPKEYGPHYNNHALDIIGTRAGRSFARMK